MLTGSAAAEADSAAGVFSGTYTIVESHKADDKKKAAIEGVVDQMNFLSKGIARERLTEGSPIAKTVTISQKDGQITITQDERTYTAPTDGSTVRAIGISGNELDLSLEIGPGIIEQKFAGDDNSGRVNNWKLDGKKLTLTATIYSESLPKDVVYDVVYEKK